MYDPATNTWTEKSPLPITGHSGLTGVIDNKLYVLTGCDFEACDSFTPAALFRYDPATTSGPACPFPTPRPSYFPSNLGGTIGKELYVSGGSAGLSVYDPATDSWASKAAMPSPRSGFAATRVVLDGASRIHVVGGLSPDNNQAYIA